MGLIAGDLNDLVLPIFEIDSFKSKMGDDKDIVVCSFSCMSEGPAKDLMNFFEKGYPYILDADVTSGEQTDGTYKVFVEIEREKDAVSQIIEMTDGVKNLTGIEELKYRYYKNFSSHNLTQESLSETLPVSSDDYGIKVNESNLNNYKEFFNRSFLESVTMNTDDILTIKKAWADPLHFKFVDFGPTQHTLDSINESFNADGFAEAIFLTKYIGDYNITKYGDKLTFENVGNTLVLKRL